MSLKLLGIYIHIPFCLSKCPYCDFYSLRYNAETAAAYAQSLLSGIYKLGQSDFSSPFSSFLSSSKDYNYNDYAVDSVYFGGGTPSLLWRYLPSILEALKKVFCFSCDCEITLEANPAALSYEALCSLKKEGFNRISIGVQASNDEELKCLGRLHCFSQARQMVQEAYKSGFSKISVDLMLGTPGQTEASISHFANVFSKLPVGHISGYLLQIEEGTPFARRHMESRCPDDDASACLYTHTVKTLEALGFMQYEVSNFAKAGFESRHNLKYWNCMEYLGLGPSAHSFIAGRRLFFPPDVQSFISASSVWELLQEDCTGGDFFEYAMLRLRLKAGLLFALALERFPNQDFSALIKSARFLQAQGLVLLNSDGIRLTVEGFLISTSVIGRLLLSL